MEVMRLLDELDEVLDSASGIGKRVFVNRDEVIDIIKELRIKLPDEIKQAQWIKDEKQRILSDARNDAQGIIDEAEDKVKKLVERDQIKKEAEDRANEIIESAHDKAYDIMSNAFEYSDELFKALGEKISNMNTVVEKNRNDLQTFKNQISDRK